MGSPKNLRVAHTKETSTCVSRMRLAPPPRRPEPHFSPISCTNKWHRLVRTEEPYVSQSAEEELNVIKRTCRDINYISN